jgi:hypothetical protein
MRARSCASRDGGSLWRRILGLRLTAVEAALNLLLQLVGLRGVLRLDHSLGELTQFLRAERTAFPGVPGKLDDPVLFVSRQPFDLFDDFNRCHAIRLLVRLPTRKLRERAPVCVPLGRLTHTTGACASTSARSPR